MAELEEIEMPKLSLMFDNKIMKEVPVGSRPITIGRSPDNDLPVDNLAVSNYHAKIYFEAGRMVIEDLDSLNGTFVNDLLSSALLCTTATTSISENTKSR